VAAAATHDIVLVRVQSMGYSESTEKIIAPALAAAFTIAAVRFTVGPLGDLSRFEIHLRAGGDRWWVRGRSEVSGTYLLNTSTMCCRCVDADDGLLAKGGHGHALM